jgi:uncharacterized protein (DUF2141 family)
MLIVLLSLGLAWAQPGKGQPRDTCVAEPGVTISGIISHYTPGKTIYLALYRSKETFESTRFCRSARFVGDSLPPDSLRFEFRNLPRGEYLIASYQDVDGNGVLTKGMFGIPKDPYRIYQPNYNFFGPKWEKCSFRVDADVTNADLRY